MAGLVSFSTFNRRRTAAARQGDGASGGGGGGSGDGSGGSSSHRECHYATVRRGQPRFPTFSIVKWFRRYKRGYDDEDEAWFRDNLERIRQAYRNEEPEYESVTTPRSYRRRRRQWRRQIRQQQQKQKGLTWLSGRSGSTTTVNSFAYVDGTDSSSDSNCSENDEKRASTAPRKRTPSRRSDQFRSTELQYIDATAIRSIPKSPAYKPTNRVVSKSAYAVVSKSTNNIASKSTNTIGTKSSVGTTSSYTLRRNKRAAPPPPKHAAAGPPPLPPPRTVVDLSPSTQPPVTAAARKTTLRRPANIPSPSSVVTAGPSTIRRKARAPQPPVIAVARPENRSQPHGRVGLHRPGKGPAPKPPVQQQSPRDKKTKFDEDEPKMGAAQVKQQKQQVSEEAAESKRKTGRSDREKWDRQMDKIEKHFMKNGGGNSSSTTEERGENGKPVAAATSAVIASVAEMYAKMAVTNLTELDKRAAEICHLNKLRKEFDERHGATTVGTLPRPHSVHYAVTDITNIARQPSNDRKTMSDAEMTMERRKTTGGRTQAFLEPGTLQLRRLSSFNTPREKLWTNGDNGATAITTSSADHRKPAVPDKQTVLGKLVIKVPTPAPRFSLITSTPRNHSTDEHQQQQLIRHKRLEFFEKRQTANGSRVNFGNNKNEGKDDQATANSGNNGTMKSSFGTQTNSAVVPTKASLDVSNSDSKSLQTSEDNNNCYLRLVAMEMQSDLVLHDGDFECAVCLCTYDNNGVVLRDCLHVFCRPCLQMTIGHSKAEQVRCPYINAQYSCTGVLQHREIKKILDSDEEYERFLQRSVERARQLLAKGRDQRSFQCRRPDCTGWCLIDDRNGVFEFKCPVCATVTCVRCGSIHALGEACQTPKGNNVGDGDGDGTLYTLENLIECGDAMSCPGCNTILSKQQGCDWIKCAVCSMEICWATKGPRWGPKGKGDTTAGCMCGIPAGRKCHVNCKYCH